MSDENLQKTDRSRVKREHERALYDRDVVNSILDASPLCHVAYVIDGKPYCTPTLQWREGDHVYWHGSSASRFLRQAEDTEVCLTVTHFDGLVLARSAFYHSVNYRSVMLFGKAERVPDDEKAAKLKNVTDAIFPGRWDSLRPISDQEVKATAVFRMKIDEGAAKVRAGDPEDEEEDYALPIWAGVIPLTLTEGEIIPDPRNLDGVELPEHLKGFRLDKSK